jgi:hypothetical protein
LRFRDEKATGKIGVEPAERRSEDHGLVFEASLLGHDHDVEPALGRMRLLRL